MGGSFPSSSGFAHLAALDAEIRQLGPRRSLCPERREATTLVELGESLCGDGAERRAPFAVAMAEIVRSLIRHFPNNLFWDLDYLAGYVASQLRQGAGSGVEPSQVARPYVELHARFGVRSAIRFAYGHDFYYGFDWAKWVRKQPADRAEHGPFSARFLSALYRRGGELLDSIDKNDDPQYPPLVGDAPRNPFGFSRSPRDEERLHRELAARGDLPLRAWDVHAVPSWRVDYAARRDAMATRLGIAPS